MTKAAIIISAILVFAGVAAASSLPGIGSGSNGTPTLDTPPLASTSTGTTGTTTTGDVRREDRRADRRADDDNNAEDMRGPCDEAEHANDPRCTGAQGQRADDGPNHDAKDDRSGPNRGPDDSSGGDSSGHGGGGDDD
jgi:hypothetical protein